MAQVEAQLIIRKRWFFWPVVLVMLALAKLGILKDHGRAGKWLGDHAMRVEVR